MIDLQPIDYNIKIITMGNANSGKSSLTERLCRNRCPRTYEPTIGVEFSSMIYNSEDGLKYKIMFWDTAGQETFAPIVKSYYKNIAGIFYLIDLTDRRSFTRFNYWLDEFHKNKTCDAKILVVGNKLDKQRRIKKEEMEYITRVKNLDYIEVSVKTGENIEKVGEILFNNIINNFDKEKHPGIHNLKAKNELNLIKTERECQTDTCCTIS